MKDFRVTLAFWYNFGATLEFVIVLCSFGIVFQTPITVSPLNSWARLLMCSQNSQTCDVFGLFVLLLRDSLLEPYSIHSLVHSLGKSLWVPATCQALF